MHRKLTFGTCVPLLVISILLGLSSPAHAAKPHPIAAGGGRVQPCAASKTMAKRVTCLVKAVRWEQSVRAHVLRVRYSLATVDYACRLGYAAFRVPVAHCKRVVGCESGGDARQVTPPYGASGMGQFLPSTWRGTRFGSAGFDIFDPVANVLAMDQIAAGQGFDTGYGWAASHHCHGLSGPEA